MRVEKIGNQTLILGDSLEIMPTLGRFDAVVTDPPYGINAGVGIGRSDRIRFKNNQKLWDSTPADVSAILALAVPAIIWGGNYFDLPPTRAPLVWDKNNAGRDFSDFEMAWSNIDMVARRIVLRPMNMDGGKQHPTQKPVALMEWCLGFLPDAKTILDPFMGSGTTLVACQSMGRHGTGIELDPDYFDSACKRVDEAARQPDLLIPETRQSPTQDAMDI